MHDVRLKVGGAEYGGWKSVHVSRSIENLAGGFEVSASETWPGQKDPALDALKIKPGDACALTIDGETVITGYVDELQVECDASSHNVTVAGRDAAGDLVDCAAIFKSGRWTNQTMQQIASDLCKPFGIEVFVATEAGADARKRLPFWSADPGETVFGVLQKLAEHLGVLVISDGLGGLVITRASNNMAAPLTLGKNILSAAVGLSYRERYSLYTAIAQGQGWNDGGMPERWISPKGQVSDATMSALRYRPLIVFHDGYAPGGVSLEERAQWEANVRAGRSLDVKVKVQGWTQPSGRLWHPNTVSHVSDPKSPHWLRLDNDMLIKGVDFVLDDQGSITELSLTHPDAFKRIPIPQHPDNWMSLARTASRPAKAVLAPQGP